MTDPGQYARDLSGRAHGPHDDQATTGAAALAAETIRYLSYATTHGGLSDPATVYAVAGDLSAAAFRLPQLLTQLVDWIDAEAAAGRIVGDRPATRLDSDARAIFGEAVGHAASLAAALADAHNLTATMRAANRATEAIPARSCSAN